MTELAVAKIVRNAFEWAKIISGHWEEAEKHAVQAVSYAVQTGKDLIEAKAALPWGQFAQMIEQDLPFGKRKAQMLMDLAAKPHLSDAQATAHLPPNWATLYELSKMSEENLADATKSGLVNPKTTERQARAIGGAYDTPEGEAWGKGKSPAHLPTPIQAREIARQTKRMVAASDGHLYSGATMEEGAEHDRRRQQTYGVRDAVSTLADCVDADIWVAQAEPHQIHDFKLSSIDGAIRFLTELREEMNKKQGVIDAQ